MNYTQFLNFEPSNDKQELLKKFLEDPNNVKLAKIMTKHKKNIVVNIYEPKVVNIYEPKVVEDKPDFYLVMIRGCYDRILVELGKKYGFPRGFPILWFPNSHNDTIQYFGFLPKFENDERQMMADNLADTKVQKIQFFKKWSGFLGQLLVWEYAGKRWWTVCSKNSANFELEFVQEARRLFEPFITPTLVDDMIAHKLHICAEMISMNDQVHGARVLKESPIITVIGKQLSHPDPNKFIDFLNHQQVVEFCNKHHLPCDSGIVVDGLENCHNILLRLSEERDFLNDYSFNILIESCKTTIFKGTITHNEILGNTLEGVVMKITKSDGSTETKKYKFPNYTIRTMLFRTEFGNSTFNNDADKAFLFSQTLKRKAQRFVNHWCVSQSGRKFWFLKALQGFLKYHNNRQEFINEQSPVGLHIRLVESLDQEICDEIYDELYDIIDETNGDFTGIEKQFDDVVGNSISSTVIVIVGPIGSGKSTIAKKLTKQLGDISVEIDGDNLFGVDDGGSLTLNLGAERNPYTLWKVIEGLMNNKIPILSTGGGVLFGKNDFILREAIHKVLGTNINLIVLAASNQTSTVTSAAAENSDQFETVYQNTQSVKETVERRVQCGSWTVPDKFISKKNGVDIKKFSKMISDLSKKNVKFCKRLVEEADDTFIFPYINEKNFGQITSSVNFDAIRDSLVLPKISENIVGNFMQIRILCHITDNRREIDVIKHITLSYDPARSLQYSLTSLKKVIIPHSVMMGKLYTFISSKKKISLVIPNNNLLFHDDGSTHLTVNNGVHAAQMMKSVALKIHQLQTENNSEGDIELPVNKGSDTIVYPMNLKTNYTACKIRILDIFGI